MKKLLTLVAVGMVLASGTSLMAAGRTQFKPFKPTLIPVKHTQVMQVPAAPAAEGEYTVVASEPVVLFHNVRVEDYDNIAPCAVPMIVQVKDPCACCDPCNCCGPRCVNVQICVPPCGCPPRIKCNKDGSKICYDYGKYEIEITSRKGYVKVDYDD